ncbi:MAG: hydrogenase 3 maturation endopeptidase HyCI [Gammaproteobacteria bacterium]|nr:hydrogenase 3 maturation endopeptidase HyCI [Gammaproteobacteria bacterium]
MGIGNETNGDDAAGVIAARALLPRLAGRDDRLVLDAGAAPENFTGPVRRFQPDLVILIDAAQMDEAPGAVCWLDWTETDGMSASTHTLPPYVLAKFLVADTGCELALIGIQPAQNAFGAPLSPVVAGAVEDVVNTLAGAL